MNKYEQWIAARLQTGADPFCKCAEWTQDMLQDFPELKRVRGEVTLSSLMTREHWWLEDPEGNVVDPTAAQFKQPYYGGASILVYCARDESQPEPTGMCPNCGEYCYEGSAMCCRACEISYMAYLNNP